VASPLDDGGPSRAINVSETERWARVKEIFDAAVACPIDDRAALVHDMCSHDRALQADVESLLAADAGASSRVGQPVDRDIRGDVFSAIAGVLDHRTHAFAPGNRLGTYDITGPLGAGGMGRVYRARDTTLGREVALKILPDRWLADPDRCARFEREARMLASLNHPNIGSIYGVHESEPSPSTGLVVKALVLELVEGETLADVIARHAQPTASRSGLSIDDVVSYASLVIEALEAAHERGIVHRDLKPANIKVTPDGRVKVLDFGLARAMDSSGSGPGIASPPTVTVSDTQDGVLLGTAPYMSPEQARGRTVDKRTDIWAFGCVLYEMLTGAPAFVGDGVAEVLANVIKAEPKWSALPPDTPATLRLCLERCLQKDLRQRFHDIADVRLAMEGAFELPAVEQGSDRRTGRHGPFAYAGWALALLALAGAVALVTFAPGPASALPETRLEIVTPDARDPLSFALSPDGRRVVFQAGQDPPRLWLRSLDSTEARPLSGTDGAVHPFWSPDGGSLGFAADGVLKRIDLDTGLVRTLAGRHPAGGTWSADGTILIGSIIGPLYRIQEEGGALEEATRLLRGQNSHRWPQFLPDGRRFLLFTLGLPDVRGVYRGSAADLNVERVADRDSGYRFLPPTHVLLARQGALWAGRMNREHTRVEGEFVLVAPEVLVHRGVYGYAAFSTSSTGSIAYRGSAGETQLAWVDRSGRPAGVVGTPDDSQLSLEHSSTDGRTIIAGRTIAGKSNVWRFDTQRGAPHRLTFGVTDGPTVISPDGTRVVYQAEGPRDGSILYERQSDGTGDETVLLEESFNEWHQPQDWSGDNRYILYRVQTTTGADLWALPLFGDRKPFSVTQTSFSESNARFSPDSRSVAYASDETGQNEIYVQPFAGAGPKLRVSVGGGTLPRWRHDGRELFYVAPDRRLMIVSVAKRGSNLEMGPARALFPLSTTTGYEPSSDGQRFLVTAVISAASPIVVILNWKPPGQ
jgi:serine/threonine protein kinase/Tol biopolymer transport system component